MTSHRVPRQTVSLGTVLDATLEHQGHRIQLTRVRGWHLLTDVDAFDRVPGKARLFLVRGKLVTVALGEKRRSGERAYERWHERQAERVGDLNVADLCKWPQGRMSRIGYRSDKWEARGKTHDYDHDFREDGGRCPLVYSDKKTLDASSTLIVLGGSMRVTEGGID